MQSLGLLNALLLGVVEGLTEFIPVSSTGHLIIASTLLGGAGEKNKLFIVVIQLGAILAVCWEYRLRLAAVVGGLGADPAARRFAANLVVGFLPAAVLGVLFHSAIKSVLFHAVPVAMALVAGGLLILWLERRGRPVRIAEVDELRWIDALKIGFAQSLALIPGTSRSGATIIGGLYFGLSRRAATEFSFFLAIPTMFGAVIYDLYRNRALLTADDLDVFAAGFVASFVAGLFVVRGLLRYVSRHDFRPFAYYRIAFGLLVLVTAYFGWIDWSVDL
ncbi:MAG TPA: undecaprenyl-diphosphate phosphatase [Burkholderiales bacterium]|nr:undecaprenyl-diphosphate phosphatase [Burkholderiales bacterium]